MFGIPKTSFNATGGAGALPADFFSPQRINQAAFGGTVGSNAGTYSVQSPGVSTQPGVPPPVPQPPQQPSGTAWGPSYDAQGNVVQSPLSLDMRAPGYNETMGPQIVDRLLSPAPGQGAMQASIAGLQGPIRGQQGVDNALLNLAFNNQGGDMLQDVYGAYQQPIAGMGNMQDVYSGLGQQSQGYQRMDSLYDQFGTAGQGRGMMQDVYSQMGTQGQGAGMLEGIYRQAGKAGRGDLYLNDAYSRLGQSNDYQRMLQDTYDAAGQPGRGQEMLDEVWTGLQGPSQTQDFWSDYESQIMGMAGDANPLNQAYSSFQGNRPDLALDPNLGAYYDNAKRRAEESIDTAAAARGAYGSSAALDQSREAFTNLEAERANREADYSLARAGEMRGWEGLGANIAGNLASSQLGAMGLGQGAAQAAGADVLGRLQGMQGTAGMMAQDELGRLGIQGDTAGMLASDLLNRQLGQGNIAGNIAQNEAQRLGIQQAAAAGITENELQRLIGQGNIAQSTAADELGRLQGQGDIAQSMASDSLQRLMSQGTIAGQQVGAELDRLAGAGRAAEGFAANDLRRGEALLSGAAGTRDAELSRLLGLGNVGATLGGQDTARVTGAAATLPGIQGSRENRIQTGFDNIARLTGGAAETVARQLGQMYDSDAALIDALMGFGNDRATAEDMARQIRNQQFGGAVDTVISASPLGKPSGGGGG